MDANLIKEALQNSAGRPILKRNSRKLGDRVTDEELMELKKIWGMIAGREFVFNEENKKLLNILTVYFLLDNRVKQYEIDPDKGILLIGNKGVGKTTIMNIFTDFMNHLYKTQQITLRQIISTSTEKIKDWYLMHSNYNKFVYNEDLTGCSYPYEIIINEFGIQYDFKFYGTSLNDVMTSLMMSRYEIFIERGILTHATSNLDTEEMAKIYDPMLIDRFKEMFNVIELKGESFRK
jgi:DNA replication protein DnaC